jgi:hypothetical protein
MASNSFEAFGFAGGAGGSIAAFAAMSLRNKTMLRSISSRLASSSSIMAA